MSLNARQKRFADEYLIDLNASAAYTRAGYKGDSKTASVNASRLLGNDCIAQYVKAALDKRSNDLGIDARYVLMTIKETVERCKNPSGDEKFDAANVLKGCDLLGKHLKLFTDKLEIGGNINVTLSSTDARL
jgi:phage terminase small subunit